MVDRSFRLGLTRRVAQVMAHLGAQSALDERLLELLKDILQLPRRHRPGNQLLQQLSPEFAATPPCPPQRCSSCVAFMLLVVMLCLAHKIPYRLRQGDSNGKRLSDAPPKQAKRSDATTTHGASVKLSGP